jgi:deazaflavin-dependent oxidoreductase (nitroreductase family)
METPGLLQFDGNKRIFPQPGTNLAKILAGDEYRQTFHANLKRWNPIIAFLYRIGILNLFGVSRTVMLLITKGCKTGKTRYTPIGYFDIGGSRYLISAWGTNTGWYKNMMANPDNIWIQVRSDRQHVQPVLLKDPQEVLEVLKTLIVESPEVAKYLIGWDAQTDRIESSDFTPILEQVLLIRFDPCKD